MMRAFRWAWLAAAACLWVSGWTAGASAQAPRICPTFTPPPIPEAKEGVSYSAKLMTGAVPAQVVYAPPPALAFSDGVLAGVPEKPGTYSFSYKVALDYACAGFSGDGPGHWVRTETHQVKVHDLNPPQITSFTVAATELTAAGGTITLELKATDNFGVTRALLTTKHPDGHSGSTYMRQAGGYNATNQKAAPAAPVSSTWTQAIPIPANTSTGAVTWTFTATAMDPEPNGAKAGPVTVTVAGRTTEVLPRPPIKR